MKKTTTFLSLILIFSIVAQVGLTVDSYPGFHGGSECSYCHNEPATAVYENITSATIDLDGEPTEEYWEEYQFRRNMVPVVYRAPDRSVDHRFVETIFSQNTTHIFVLMIVDVDSHKVISNSTHYDGIAMMWNIDSTDDSFNTNDGMLLGDGTADMWFWKASADDAGKNNTIMTTTVKDYSLDDGGWDKSETSDVKSGVKHIWQQGPRSIEIGYVYEFARPLTTAELDVDVQFEYSGYYSYSIAMWDESSGSGHLMGYPHEVYVQGAKGEMPLETVTETETETASETFTETKTDTPITFGYFGIALISSVALITYTRRRN